MSKREREREGKRDKKKREEKFFSKDNIKANPK